MKRSRNSLQSRPISTIAGQNGKVNPAGYATLCYFWGWDPKTSSVRAATKKIRQKSRAKNA